MIREELIEEGIVIKSGNGFIEIELLESESCHECGARLFCKSTGNKNKHLNVYDPYGSHNGDKVKISVPGSAVLKATIFLYGLPLIILIISLVLGMTLLKYSSLSELYSFLIAIFNLCVYYSLLFILNRNHNRNLSSVKIISITRKSV